jgi:hypothetical protein
MSPIWHLKMATILLLVSLILLLAYLRFSAIRSNRSSAEIEDGDQLPLARSDPKVRINIAVFALLLFLGCFGIVFVTVAVTVFLGVGGSPFSMVFVAIVAIVAWIQSSILEIRFRSNRAWYNTFSPNFLIDCATSLPIVIYTFGVINRMLAF